VPEPLERPLRLGVAGCGFVTTEHHLPALRRVPEIEVVALADLDATRAESVARAWNVFRSYGDPSELIADPVVEAVAVCTPAASHVELGVATLAAGKHLFVEKPLSVTLADADRLVERGGESAVAAATGFNLRWHRHAREARRIVAAGALGRVNAVQSTFSDSTRFRPGLPAWRTRRELGGGVFLEKAVHHFDLWRFLLSDELRAVSAWSSSSEGDDDTATVTARLESGALGTMLLDDTGSIRNELTIFGRDGTLGLDFYRFDGVTVTPAGEVPGAPAGRVRRLGTGVVRLAGSAGTIRRGGDFRASYEAEWREFAAAIRGRRAPGCGLADGRAALAAALAAAGSASRGEQVELR
jgi:myo-inositol 2-dehydrogenase/D-chiro-inositol 1-dehydrogenase